MNNNKLVTILLALFVLLAMVNQARAEDSEPDKFKIAIGSYALGRFDSTMSLTEPNLGAGVSISPEDTLGVDLKQTVTRLDGYYRFNNKHALTYSWYNINSTGNKSIEEDISWINADGEEITIRAGADLQSSLDYDIYKIGYLWSFYHTDKVELAAGAGLHITRIAVGLDVAAGIIDPPSASRDTKKVDTTVPLPVLSFALTYNVTPKFSWYLKSEVFAISFGDWSGTYSDSTLGVEYRAWKNVGLGIGLGSNSLKIVEETGDYEFQYDNRISGLNLYVAAYF